MGKQFLKNSVGMYAYVALISISCNEGTVNSAGSGNKNYKKGETVMIEGVKRNVDDILSALAGGGKKEKVKNWSDGADKECDYSELKDLYEKLYAFATGLKTKDEALRKAVDDTLFNFVSNKSNRQGLTGKVISSTDDIKDAIEQGKLTGNMESVAFGCKVSAGLLGTFFSGRDAYDIDGFDGHADGYINNLAPIVTTMKAVKAEADKLK